MADTPPRTLYCSRCLTTFPGDAEKCPNLGCRAARPTAGWGELLEAGGVIDRTYRVHKLLAIGGAGVTYLGAELENGGQGEVGPRVAIKVLYQQRDQGSYLRRLATEAQILQGLNHPNIVECRGFVHRTGHSPYLVTRFMEGGSLLDHLRRVGTLPVGVAAGIGRQVCWALDVAHRQGVVHRDLKPENVLLESPTHREQIPVVRVADFGIAKVYGGVGERLTRVGAFVGTPQFAAPEQFDGLSPEPATDVYALGALVYFCVAGRHVADFMAELEPESQREHLLRHLPPRVGDDVPQPLRRWLEDTLAVSMAVDPGDRCDISQLEQRLAALQEGRDPGFVRLPPHAAAFGTPPPIPPPLRSAHTLQTTDTLDLPGIATDELPKPPPPARTGPPPLPPVDASPPPPPPVDPAPLSLDAPAYEPPAFEAPAFEAPPELAEPPAFEAPPELAEPPVEPPPFTPPSVQSPELTVTRPTAGHTVSASFSSRDVLRLPPEEAPPARSSRLGCWALAAISGLAGVVVLGAAAFFTLSPSVDTLTASETDATRAREWKLVAGGLGERAKVAVKACGAPAYLQIEGVVDADGSVREIKLLNYEWEATRACVEAQMQAQAPMQRERGGAVRVALSLGK